VDVRRTSSVRTLSRCHFYKLAKTDFDEVLEAYPELKVPLGLGLGLG
jgi:CRP-like cAMP-binding protein